MSSPVVFEAKQSDAGRLLPDRVNRLSATPQSMSSEDQDRATTPLEVDITAPSPSTSETSTVFTDLDGGDEEQVSETERRAEPVQKDRNKAAANKSPTNSLKVQKTSIT